MRPNAYIRHMKPEDYQVLLSLWVACDGVGLRSEEDSRAGFEAFLARNPDTCFAALMDGVIVGSILAGHDGRRGFLYHVAVDAAFRRRHIGTELVRRATNALRRAGIRKTALVVYEDNREAAEFWGHLGFLVRDDLVYRDRANT